MTSIPSQGSVCDKVRALGQLGNVAVSVQGLMLVKEEDAALRKEEVDLFTWMEVSPSVGLFYSGDFFQETDVGSCLIFVAFRLIVRSE